MNMCVETDTIGMAALGMTDNGKPYPDFAERSVYVERSTIVTYDVRYTSNNSLMCGSMFKDEADRVAALWNAHLGVPMMALEHAPAPTGEYTHPTPKTGQTNLLPVKGDDGNTIYIEVE